MSAIGRKEWNDLHAKLTPTDEFVGQLRRATEMDRNVFITRCAGMLLSRPNSNYNDAIGDAMILADRLEELGCASWRLTEERFEEIKAVWLDD